MLWLIAVAAPVSFPAPPVVPGAAAASEQVQWAAVRKVDSEPAYRLYLRRFPDGIHRNEAEAALRGREDHSSAPPQSAPPAAWQMVDPPYDTHAFVPERRPAAGARQYVQDLCIQASSFEAPQDVAAYREVRVRNSIQDYLGYLSAFPHGACRSHAQIVLDQRAKRAKLLSRIPGLGPLPPHPLRAFVIGIGDYPYFAMRKGETGTVKVQWEVAADGSVEMCRVVSSSGSRDLDAATCRLITLRMIYDPARDAAGSPTRAIDGTNVDWKLAR